MSKYYTNQSRDNNISKLVVLLPLQHVGGLKLKKYIIFNSKINYYMSLVLWAYRLLTEKGERSVLTPSTSTGYSVKMPKNLTHDNANFSDSLTKIYTFYVTRVYNETSNNNLNYQLDYTYIQIWHKVFFNKSQ